MSETLKNFSTPAPEAQPLAPDRDTPVDQRNAWLKAKIDNNPTRPLPDVELIKQEKELLHVSFEEEPEVSIREGDPRLATEHFEIVSPDEGKLGFVVLKTDSKDGPYSGKKHIGDIKIDEKFRDKGYGPATYLELLQELPQGVGLRTEGVMSDDAIKMWTMLTDRGVARPITGEYVTTTGFETVF